MPTRSVREPSQTLPDQIHAFRSFTMAHPRLLEAREQLLDAIEAAAPGSLILVVGPTGVGKTTLRRKVEETLIEKMRPGMMTDPGQLPFVSLEAVAPDAGSFHWRDHFQRMLSQMKEPLMDNKLGSYGSEGERNAKGQYASWPRGCSGYQLQQAIENALLYRHPAAVIIDEAQHLGRMASGRKLADQLDVVKSIASRSRTVHVLIGTYELLAFRNLSGQLSRRSVDLHFPRYRAESSTDLDTFQSAVFTFQKQFPHPDELDLLSIWDFLYERSVGCIGILKDWLLRALVATVGKRKAALTFTILEKTALSGSQCEKILAEARDGEAHLTESSDARARLRRLLNLPETDAAPLGERTASAARKVSRGSYGVRLPQRDQIGNIKVAEHA